LAQWPELRPETAMARAKFQSIYPFVVQYQKLAATNRAPAAAGRSTRTAAAEWRKLAPRRLSLSFRAKSRTL
jgi:hypothetical protein